MRLLGRRLQRQSVAVVEAGLPEQHHLGERDGAFLPFVSVVIPAYNRRELLGLALDGLERQTYPADRMEVIVVDNGCDDGTIDDLAQRRPPWRLRGLRFERNRTPAEARNAGLEVAEGEVIAFTDSDCVPAPEWIAAGVAAFDRGIGIVQGKTLPIVPGRGAFCVTQQLEEPSGRYETCNVFYLAGALRRAGGFPQDLGFFGEDTAAAWEVRRLGFDDRFAAESVVHHAVSYPGLTWFFSRAELYSNWNVLVKRYPELRREVLWGRFFIDRRNAAFVLAVVGLLLGQWRPAALLLVAPYAKLAFFRGRLTRRTAEIRAKWAMIDGMAFLSLAKGSVQHRCLVL